MCGIAGCSSEDPQRIERMTQALRHRGPDGHATYVGHGISLGHARLAILDPSPEGNQPMWNADRTVAIVYNGEIFNYRELKEQEELQCETGTDTEVLLKLYERMGMEFLPRLRGMFAFALFDTRNRTWYLARDESGIKPLYIAADDRMLFVASEVRAIMAGMGKKPPLNLRALSLYMRLQYVPGPETLIEGVESLTPGTLLTWKDGEGHRTHFTQRHDDKKKRSRKTFMRDFPDIMDKAVEEHLVSDKPVGIFLSGGMDSSIVLHHMAQHSVKSIPTFTVRFEATAEEGAERFNADAQLAALTAKHYGTKHHELNLTAEMFRDAYRDCARSLDQPNADHVSVAQFLLARMAKQHVDVVLNGSGGDELFGGYPRYRIARILDRLQSLPPEVRSFAGRMAGYPSDVLAMQPGAMLAERLLARSVNETESIVKGGWFDPLATSVLFGSWFATCHTGDHVRDFMEVDRHLWLVDESLRLCDGTTMGSGLECRVPFLDPRVMDAAHSIGSSYHVTMRRTKALLKDTYKSILPEHLFSLKKASFYPPLAKWLRREAAPLVEEMLVHPRIAEYFNVEAVRKIWDNHRSHQAYGLHALSTLIQLQHWFDAVYDS